MKIGLFTSVEGWGGSETYLLSLMAGVHEAGHVPVLFGIEGTRLLRDTRAAGIQCVAWKTAEGGLPRAGTDVAQGKEQSGNSRRSGVKRRLLGGMPGWLKLLLGNIREIRRLQKMFRANHVDVMHVNLSGYEVAGVACRLCGIPSIGWHCIMPFRDPSVVRSGLIRWTCWSYSLMGGTSQACVDAWRKLSGLPVRRCRMVWNGIDLHRFEGPASHRRVSGDPFVCLAVGRLHPMKGFDVLIRAVGLLNDPCLKVVIAGEGPFEAELKRLALEQPCSVAITFAGHREDMETLYRQADCMILPSVSHESFGLVLAEAMACGLPLITSDFGPLPEINPAGKTGMVVPAGSAEALADAIRRIADEPELGAQYGEAGRRRVKECFSLERMVAEMIALYEGLLKSAH